MSQDDPTEKEVRYNVKMPKKLRDDAKRNADRGELAQQVRDVFRRKAYGTGIEEEYTELEEKRHELEAVRAHIDELRFERSKIETEIESEETRAARLEEQIARLEEESDQLQTQLEMLENMLLDGERMYLDRVKMAADVDEETALELHERLKQRNSELPPHAFERGPMHENDDWREAEN